jgi:hypothetical protein
MEVSYDSVEAYIHSFFFPILSSHWDPYQEQKGSILDTMANIQEQDPGSWHKTKNKNKKKGHNSEVQFLWGKSTR